MLVLQGTTPEEVRTSIVGYLKQCADRYAAQSATRRLKVDKACDMARHNALLSAAYDMEHCNLADFKKTPGG